MFNQLLTSQLHPKCEVNQSSTIALHWCKVLQTGLLSVVFVEACLEVSVCEDQSALLFVFELLINGLLLMECFSTPL